MNTNSVSEEFWKLLHQTRALLEGDGFAEPPPFPSRDPVSNRGYDEVVDRYREFLAFGESWVAGHGTHQPQALLISAKPLTESALAFVRSWFENPRVQLSLENDLFLQPLPAFTAEDAPWKGFFSDLARLFSPKVILSLGTVPAQHLLGAPLSLESLRATDYRFESWSLVTTLDPEDYASVDPARQNAFKGAVWKDLQRLLGKVRYG